MTRRCHNPFTLHLGKPALRGTFSTTSGGRIREMAYQSKDLRVLSIKKYGLVFVGSCSLETVEMDILSNG